MYNLTKKEKLNIVLEKIQELKLSAYEIANNTKLTEAGVSRIIKRVAKNPHESSLDLILSYLDKKQLGSDLSTENTVNESPTVYEKQDLNKKYITCIETEIKLLKEVQRLQGILRKNKIEFDDIFE